jgi:hypothetical protein
MAGDVGIQEDRDACVDEHGEDVAEGASRHGVPPCREKGEVSEPLGATVYFIDDVSGHR